MSLLHSFNLPFPLTNVLSIKNKKIRKSLLGCVMLIKKYLLNCFLLFIPIILWNILLVGYLPEGYDPEIFWKDIPKLVGYSENSLRIVVFVLPAFMVLSFKTNQQKVGFFLYLVGVVIYFLSWVIMILYPESYWGQSMVGFMAPAYTTIIWLTGIGLIGTKSFFKIPHMSIIYIILSFLFVAFHSLHTYIVYQRL